MNALNERMRIALATVAITKRRSSHMHRRWAREANAAGKSIEYHEHMARYLRDWGDAKDALRDAKNWS